MVENGVNSGARMSVKIKRRSQNGLKNLQINQVGERKLKNDPITAQNPTNKSKFRRENRKSKTNPM